MTDTPVSRFLAACRREPVERVPIWFMRQAGRSLPEYRAARGEGSILEAVTDPELAAKLTMQPVERYGVDAAILYSDIMVPAASVGFGIALEPGRGPVVAEPFRTEADLNRLKDFQPELHAPYVAEAARICAQRLEPLGVPLIGFAGAPFTVASYLIEGGASRDYALTKRLMWGEPDLWNKLLGTLAQMAIASLRAQVEAGAAAVQLFDSWVGTLSPDDYASCVMPATRRVLEEIADLGVPRIHFGVGTGELLGLMAQAGADVVGVDWRVPLRAARTRVGSAVALQGNLDPVTCLAPWPVVEQRARAVLEAGGGFAHIFNLGHGVLPETDPSILERLVQMVKETPVRELQVGAAGADA